MTVRDDVVAGARRWLGTRYVWGGESEAEGGVDCSGLVIDAYRRAGRALKGRPIASQLGQMGTAVPLASALPGDLIYQDQPGATDHVGIYLGGGQMIEAPYSGANVRVSPVNSYTSVRRILDDAEGGSVLGGVGQVLGDITSGRVLDDAAGDALAKINPFDNWASDALGIGVKLAVTAAALGLVVAGAMKTVSKD